MARRYAAPLHLNPLTSHTQVYLIEGNASQWSSPPPQLPKRCSGKCIYNFDPYTLSYVNRSVRGMIQGDTSRGMIEMYNSDRVGPQGQDEKYRLYPPREIQAVSPSTHMIPC